MTQLQINSSEIEDIFINEFKSDIKKFSKYIVTLIEKHSSSTKGENIISLGGSLHKYADSSKIELEDKAWELHIEDKYQ